MFQEILGESRFSLRRILENRLWMEVRISGGDSQNQGSKNENNEHTMIVPSGGEPNRGPQISYNLNFERIRTLTCPYVVTEAAISSLQEYDVVHAPSMTPCHTFN